MSRDQQWSPECDTMKPIVKSIWIDESNDDLETYIPEDPTCFGLWVEMRVGFEGGASDDFRILVCTPAWLKKVYEKNSLVWGRHILLVFECNLCLVKAEIIRRVEACSGDTWLNVAQKINRFAVWEFEDYQE